MTGLMYHKVLSQHLIPDCNLDEIYTCLFQQVEDTSHHTRDVKHPLTTSLADLWIGRGSGYIWTSHLDHQI